VGEKKTRWLGLIVEQSSRFVPRRMQDRSVVRISPSSDIIEKRKESDRVPRETPHPPLRLVQLERRLILCC
jgi:hypothetical protein